MGKNLLIRFIFCLLFLLLVCFSGKSQNCQGDDKKWNFVPDELFRGRLQNYGKYGNPYTMFIKEDNFSLELQLLGINQTIKNDEYSFNLFFNLYNFALSNEPSICNNQAKDKINEDAYCMHAAWVKANAIIYLLGIKPIGPKVIDTLPLSDKEDFATRAFDGLTKMDAKFNLAFWNYERVRMQAQLLMQYLQAYDMLKTGGKIAAYDGDRNLGPCSPRNKLRLYAKSLYENSDNIINSRLGWKKNHGIICASALGMAAIVLNDAGTETNIGNFIFGWLPGVGGSNWPRPDWNPQNWQERSIGHEGEGWRILGKEDGLKDNFFVGEQRLRKNDVPMTNSDGTAGYAEGPGYLLDLGSTFLPYLRTLSNYYDKEAGYNLIEQDRFKNLLNWYLSILNIDNTIPNYDNSEFLHGNIFGVLGMKEFPGNPSAIKTSNEPLDLRGDYLLALGSQTGVNRKVNNVYFNDLSGNYRLNYENGKGAYSFHVLAEKGVAIDDWKKNEKFNTHEDDDVGSYMLFVGDSSKSQGPLAVDPAYMGWGDDNGAEETNKYFMHNTVEIDDGKYSTDREYTLGSAYEIKNPFKNNGVGEFEVNLDFKSKDENLVEDAIKRNYASILSPINTYFIITDYIDATPLNADSFQSVLINLNGNGRNDHVGTLNNYFTYRKVNNLNIWSNSCKYYGWLMAAHFAGLKGGLSNSLAIEDPYELNTSTNGTQSNGTIDNNFITRMKFYQPIRKTILQTVILPLKCGDTLPTVTKRDTFENLLTTEIDFIQGVDTSFDARLGKSTFALARDTVSHLHLVKWEGGSDSLSNPFNRPNQSFDYLFFDGSKLFLENHTLSYMGVGFGYCPPSYINLRKFIAYNSSYLIFKDTLFHSTIGLDFDYSVTGKNNYTCQISTKTTPSSTATLKIKLPEVGRGIDMVALISGTNDTLHGRYDSLNNYIYLALKPGNYSINIKPSNPA